MLCPHCSKDTPATLPYCQHCGLSVDLTFDKVQASFVEEASAKAIRETEERCRFYLLSAAAVLVVAVAARLLLVPATPAEPVLPPYFPGEPAEVASAPAVEPLPFEVPPIEVPK